jgi:hypothetical protein
LVTAFIPSFITRRLELDELNGALDNVEIEENDADGARSGASLGGCVEGRGKGGEGISTAFRVLVCEELGLLTKGLRSALPSLGVTWVGFCGVLVGKRLVVGGTSLELAGLVSLRRTPSRSVGVNKALFGLRASLWLGGAATTISSSTTSLTGIRFFGIVNRLKKCGIVVLFAGAGIAAWCGASYMVK